MRLKSFQQQWTINTGRKAMGREKRSRQKRNPKVDRKSRERHKDAKNAGNDTRTPGNKVGGTSDVQIK